MTHQPAISISISFHLPFNRASGRTFNLRPKMKFLYVILLLMLAPVVTSLGDVPKPVTNLGGSDDIEKLIEGYPPEEYEVSSTLCGLKPTPEFRDGFTMALRLCRLGADPHYLVYDELEDLPKPYPPLKTFGLQNYKHTARLLEAIRGFNYSMAMCAWELKARKQIQEGKHAGCGQPATAPESKPKNNEKSQPESEVAPPGSGCQASNEKIPCAPCF